MIYWADSVAAVDKGLIQRPEPVDRDELAEMLAKGIEPTRPLGKAIQVREPRIVGPRTIRVVASTVEEDRDGDIVLPSGIDLTHFQLNPVFLYMHDGKHLPAGRVVDYKLDGDRLLMDVRFLDPSDFDDPSEDTKESLDMATHFLTGTMSAVSIGFMPRRGMTERRENGGFIFREVELMELSGVTIPSNRAALTIERSFGLEAVGKAVDVPQYIASNAATGLRYHEQGLSGDGLRPQTVEEARDMADGSISDDKPGEMAAWFARHESDLDAPQNSDPEHPDFPGPGAVAWYLWGGSPIAQNPMRAAEWAARTADQMESDGMADDDKSAKQLNEDTEAEIRGLLDGKRRRLDMIDNLLGADQMDADALAELVGLLRADQRANAMLLEIAGLADEPMMERSKEGRILSAARYRRLVSAVEQIDAGADLVRSLLEEARDPDAERSFAEAVKDAARPRVKMVTEYRDLPLASREREWDSDAAIQRIREATDSTEEPSEEYRTAFVWFDSEEPGEFGSYKLPIADVIDGELHAVPRGVFAAAAVIEGARGGVDIPEPDMDDARAHLGRYYAKMREEFEDFDEPAPWEQETDGAHADEEQDTDSDEEKSGEPTVWVLADDTDEASASEGDDQTVWSLA
jgi:hypothetical protein